MSAQDGKMGKKLSVKPMGTFSVYCPEPWDIAIILMVRILVFKLFSVLRQWVAVAQLPQE